MILYSYDMSGLYVGPVAAALSPARPFIAGEPNYLRPARSTEQAPPDCEQGFVPVFDGESWQTVEDHRGQAIHNTANGVARTVTEIGPFPEGWTTQPRPDERYVWDGQAWALDEGLALAAVRRIRNAMLTVCDWTQLPDSPLTSEARAAWAAYRQALRDFPSDWSLDKPWPEAPQE